MEETIFLWRGAMWCLVPLSAFYFCRWKKRHTGNTLATRNGKSTVHDKDVFRRVNKRICPSIKFKDLDKAGSRFLRGALSGKPGRCYSIHVLSPYRLQLSDTLSLSLIPLITLHLRLRPLSARHSARASSRRQLGGAAVSPQKPALKTCRHHTAG